MNLLKKEGSSEMKRKALLLTAVFLLAFLLSGCSAMFLDAGNLMAPPGATGTRQEIQYALKAAAGDELNLCYPESGAYRSAIITVSDFTGSKINDVVAFFYSPENGENVNIAFLTQMDGENWKVIFQKEKAFSLVDRVAFSDFDGDGIDEILVGWGSPIGQKSDICVYDFSNDKMTEIDMETSYNELAVGDFTGDKSSELILLSLAKTEAGGENSEAVSVLSPAQARMYDLFGGKMRCLSELELDSSVIRYSLVTVSEVCSGKTACALDCATANSKMLTQILYFKNSQDGLSVFPPLSEEAMNETSRSAAGLFSRDVNNDGYLEIPTQYYLPSAYENYNNEASPLDLVVSWKRFDAENTQLLLVSREIIKGRDGYSVSLPIGWEDKVCIYIGDNMLTLYEWDGSERGELIYQIVCTDQTDLDTLYNKYELMYSEGGRYYAVLFGNSSFGMDMTALKEYFSLIS